MIPPLAIIYQDSSLVAIDKPAGMIVHPGRETEGPEWVAMKRIRNELGCRVYPVHRLDRPTSGVLLFALDKVSAAITQQFFEQRKVTKTYHAIVEGIAPGHWTCCSPLSTTPEEELLSAATHFCRLATAPPGSFPGDPALSLSLIEARPETGRFHQIRRHLLEVGMPVVGDFRYAGQERSFQLGHVLGTRYRMLLHAKALTFPHPHSGSVLRIEAPVNPVFLKCFPDLQ